MKELQRKQRMKRVMYSLPVLILLMIATGFLVRGTVSVVKKQIESEGHVNELQKEAQALTLRSTELKDTLARLDTEAGIVEEVREKFNVTAPGEYVAVLVDSPIISTSTASSSEGWGKKWWNSFKSLWRE